MRRAIEEPLRTLADNAGQEGALIVQEVKKRKGNEGYNVATGEYEDLVKAGVVDPTKVTRSALQNAASISGLLLTTEAIITELPEKEKASAACLRAAWAAWAVWAAWITKPTSYSLAKQSTAAGLERVRLFLRCTFFVISPAAESTESDFASRFCFPFRVEWAIPSDFGHL